MRDNIDLVGGLFPGANTVVAFFVLSFFPPFPSLFLSSSNRDKVAEISKEIKSMQDETVKHQVDNTAQMQMERRYEETIKEVTVLALCGGSGSSFP